MFISPTEVVGLNIPLQHTNTSLYGTVLDSISSRELSYLHRKGYRTFIIVLSPLWSFNPPADPSSNYSATLLFFSASPKHYDGRDVR